MKILYHHRTRRTGAEGIHIQAIVDGLRAKSHEVMELSPGRSDDTCSSQMSPLARAYRQLPVICNSRFFYEVSEIAYPHIARSRLKKVANHFQPDVIYERYSLYNDAGVGVARDLGIPVVLEVNTPYALERTKYDYWGKRLTFGRLASRRELSTFRSADRIVTVTQALKDYLVGRGLEPSLITVVPNGVDLDLFDPKLVAAKASALKQSLGLGPFKVLGFVGALVQWHGLHSVLDALKEIASRLPSVKLVFVGSGPQSQQLQRAALSTRIANRVVFVGSVPHGEVAAYVGLFDIALKPDSPFWSCPIKIMEYMAMEKAIIAPDIPAIREILSDGQEALLIPPGDSGALAAATLRLLADSRLMQTLGANARAKAVARFEWSRAVEQTEAILRDLLR